MANDGFEFSAKNVDEAIADGLRALGLRRDQVDIKIINKGSRGILGFGGEAAAVRLTPHPAPPAVESAPTSQPKLTPPSDLPVVATPPAPEADQAVQAAAAVEATEAAVEDDAGDEEFELDDFDREMESLARDLLAQLLDLMGFDAEIVSTWRMPDEEDGAPYLNLDVQGDELGVLIGRRGETLANIQFLLRLMVNQQMKEWTNITVDVEQYKERRVQQLTQLANRMAEQVATAGRAMSLEPMPSNERRIIHIALRDHPAVYTESTGEGERRKVHIAPRA